MTQNNNSTTTTNLKLLERLSRAYVLRPRAFFALTIGVLVILSILTMSLGLLDLADFAFEDWLIPDAQSVKNFDVLGAARTGYAANAESLETRNRASEVIGTMFVFDTFDEEQEIFTPKNLKAICETERILVGADDYNLFCLTDNPDGEDTVCRDPRLSVSFQFYQEFNTTTGQWQSLRTEWEACEQLDEAIVTARRDFVYNIVQTPNQDVVSIPLKRLFEFFVPQGFFETGVSTFTRSQIDLGTPLEGFSEEIEAPSGDQFNEYRDFYVDVKANLLSHLDMSGHFFDSAFHTSSKPEGFVPLTGAEGDTHVGFNSFVLRQLEFATLVQADQLMAGASGLAVGIAMFLYTGSVFIAAIGMAGIGLSFPVSVFVYQLILQVPYFTQVQIVALFIILGIGADAVFVMVDAWKQSKALWYEVYEDQTDDLEFHGDSNDRKKKQARRSLKPGESIKYPDAASVNKFGTGSAETEIQVARLSYTLDRAYGSVANTALTTIGAFGATAMSSVIPVSGFGIFAATLVAVNFTMVLFLHPPMLIIHHRYFENRSYREACTSCCRKPSDEQLEQLEYSKDPNDYEHNRLEKFAVNVYNPIMTKSKLIPLTTVTVMLVFVGVMINFATKLQPPTEDEENFSSHHMFEGFMDRFTAPFEAAADSLQEVEIVWGIEGIDRPNFDRFVPSKNRGQPSFDPKFALYPEEAQRYILQVCADLRDWQCELEGCERGNNEMVFDSENSELFECFMEEFQAWYAGKTGGFRNATFELSEEDFNSELKTFAESSGFGRLLGFDDNGDPVYAIVRFRSTLVASGVVSTKEPVLKRQTKYLEENIRDPAPPMLKSVFLHSFDHVWIDTELGIVAGMFEGLAVSFPIAFAILLVSTGNVVVSAYAILTVGFIVLSVLGCMYLNGFALGVGESIAAIFVVGLSVDYTIHLGHLIVHSGAQKRVNKVLYSSTRMLSTVTISAITSLAAAVFMFLTQMAFFSKMATLLALTVVLSWLFALLFFLPLNFLIGPEGDFGDIYKFCRKGGQDSRSASGSSSDEQNGNEKRVNGESATKADVGLQNGVEKAELTTSPDTEL